MAIHRMQHDRRLAPEEATKYRPVREQVEEELPDLIARHQERMVAINSPHTRTEYSVRRRRDRWRGS
jgi:hypothetical protein